jgi:hypothetical protein
MHHILLYFKSYSSWSGEFPNFEISLLNRYCIPMTAAFQKGIVQIREVQATNRKKCKATVAPVSVWQEAVWLNGAR